ncbi:aromatic prenyltransferase [Spirillospora sp. NPDC049652]
MAASFCFSPEQFLIDARTTADAIGAPYSETVTRAVLDAYPDGFRNGAVLWRTTDRPGAPLNYRFYERRRTDTVGAAVRAGLLAAEPPYPGRIVLLNDEMGAKRVSGSFPSKDPQAVLNALQAVLGFEQHSLLGRMIVVR